MRVTIEFSNAEEAGVAMRAVEHYRAGKVPRSEVSAMHAAQHASQSGNVATQGDAAVGQLMAQGGGDVDIRRIF